MEDPATMVLAATALPQVAYQSGNLISLTCGVFILSNWRCHCVSAAGVYIKMRGGPGCVKWVICLFVESDKILTAPATRHLTLLPSYGYVHPPIYLQISALRCHLAAHDVSSKTVERVMQRHQWQRGQKVKTGYSQDKAPCPTYTPTTRLSARRPKNVRGSGASNSWPLTEGGFSDSGCSSPLCS